MSLTKQEQIVIDIVKKENDRPIPRKILINKISFNNFFKKHEYKDINFLISSLVKKGLLFEIKKTKKIVLSKKINNELENNEKYEGMIAINSSGNGFITRLNEEKSSCFVSKINLNGALNGDKVQYQILKISGEKNLKNAIITKVIERAKNTFVGIFKKTKNSYYVDLDDQNNYLSIILDDISGLADGQKILIQATHYDNDKIFGYVSKILGHTNDVGVDILSVVYDNGIEPDFKDEVLNEARKITYIEKKDFDERKDLRSLPIITIDPTTSKDFDDAIYVKKNSDSFDLYVSIADVSHYVKQNTALDRSAYERGCSVYLVDRVIPMLPHNISDDICSLNPNEDRLTLTCQMKIDLKGNIKNIDVYPSVIHSHFRFAYDQVNDYIKNKKFNVPVNKEIIEMIKDSLELHKILDQKKYQNGYINFNIPEPLIKIDKKNRPIEITQKKSGIAQNMIENFMVSANESVTMFVDKMKIPFIYRVHDKPIKDKLILFANDAKRLGFIIGNDYDNITSKEISRWIQNNKSNPNINLIDMMLLKCMSKAEYSTNNIGHFGLAIKQYTHFTSPIRRYADLIVHRILWNFVFKQNKIGIDKEKLEEISKNINQKEIIAVKTERDVNQMKFAEYMSNFIGKQFEAIITSVNAFGFFVQLENIIEGLVKIENIGDDFYTFDEKTRVIYGNKTKQTFSLGKKVLVELIHANKHTKKIEFKLVK